MLAVGVRSANMREIRATTRPTPSHSQLADRSKHDKKQQNAAKRSPASAAMKSQTDSFIYSVARTNIGRKIGLTT